MDGLTVVLTYNDGELTQAVTRGNGEIGEDITHNARVFKNIPLKISQKGQFVLRGEAVISFEDFDNINEERSAGRKDTRTQEICVVVRCVSLIQKFVPREMSVLWHSSL